MTCWRRCGEGTAGFGYIVSDEQGAVAEGMVYVEVTERQGSDDLIKSRRASRERRTIENYLGSVSSSLT
jgi:hypothetical protein